MKKLMITLFLSFSQLNCMDLSLTSAPHIISSFLHDPATYQETIKILPPDMKKMLARYVQALYSFAQGIKKSIHPHKRSLQHNDDILEKVAFDEKGTRMITAFYDGKTEVWDIENYQYLYALEGPPAKVSEIFFDSNADKMLIASDDGNVRVWDVHTGACLKLVANCAPSHRKIMMAVDTALNCLAWVSSLPTVIVVWHIQDNTLISEKEVEATITVLLYVPQIDAFATAASDNYVTLWDAQTGARRHSFKSEVPKVRCLAFDSSAHCFVTGSDQGKLCIADMHNPDNLSVIAAHAKTVNSVKYGPDSATIISSSNDMTVKIWNAQTGDLLHILFSMRKPILSASFIRGHDIIAGNSYKSLDVWDLKRRKSLYSIAVLAEDVIGKALFVKPDIAAITSRVSVVNFYEFGDFFLYTGIYERTRFARCFSLVILYL